MENIFKLTKLTFLSSSWKISQLLNIVNEVIMKFLTILLLVLSYDKQEVILVFFIFYFFNFIFLLIYKKILFKFKNLFYSIFLILIFLSILLYFITWEYIYFLSSAIFVMTSRDLFNTNSYWELNNIAEKNNIDNTKLIWFSYILWVVLSIFALPFLWLVADKNISYFIYFILILIFFIFSYFLFVNFKKQTDSNWWKEEFIKIKTPKTVYLQSLLSTLCNSTSFFWNRFLLPLFIYNVALKYWFDKNVFSIIWIFAWLIALLNLISKKTSSISRNKDLMFNNYLIYILCWFLFWVSFLLFLKLNNSFLEIFLIIFVIILNILMEYSSKLWSIWFIQTLKDQSNYYNKVDKQSFDYYNSYLTTFMIFKSLWWFIWFWLAYILYFTFNLEFIVIIFSVISIIYWIYLKKYFNNLTF